MPPRDLSRHILTDGITDDETGVLFLSPREPYRYRNLPDTRTHQVAQGDTLFTLAGSYFAPTPRACGFWWAIADFQPDPIFDPTLELVPGAILYVPSLRTLLEKVLSEERRGEEAL